MCGAAAEGTAGQPAPEAQPESGATPQAQAQPELNAQPEAQTQPDFAKASAAAAEEQAANAPQQPAPAAPMYPKGCLAQAFDDITKVKGVLPRIFQIAFLPALIAVVSIFAAVIPVIGWLLCPIGLIAAVVVANCGTGYAIEWGRDLSRGEGFDIHKPLLRTSVLSLGIFKGALESTLNFIAVIPAMFFKVFAAGGLVAFVASSVSPYSNSYTSSFFDGVVDLLDMLVSLASLALGILFAMIAAAAVMHLAVTGRAESAFSLDKVWKSCKKQLGKLFCASVLADLIVDAVAFFVVLIISVIFIGIAAAAVSSYSNSLGGYSSSGYNGFSAAPSAFDGLYDLLQLGGIILVIYLMIVAFVVMFACVFKDILKFRALGHWAARYAEEWTHEGESDFVICLPSDLKNVAGAAPAGAPQPTATDPVECAAPVQSQPQAPVQGDVPEQTEAPQNPFGPTDPGSGF